MQYVRPLRRPLASATRLRRQDEPLICCDLFRESAERDSRCRAEGERHSPLRPLERLLLKCNLFVPSIGLGANLCRSTSFSELLEICSTLTVSRLVC
jgi:hypothetical protein